MGRRTIVAMAGVGAVALVGAGILLGLALGGDSGSHQRDAAAPVPRSTPDVSAMPAPPTTAPAAQQPTSTTLPASAAVSAPAAKSAGVVVTPATVAPGVPRPDYSKPKAVADQLFAAWQKDDRAAAASVATPTAVDHLWAYSWNALDRYSGCDQDPLGFVICSYSFDQGGYLQFYVDPGRGDDWIVNGVRLQRE